MGESPEFLNSSYYIIPARTVSASRLTETLDKDPAWAAAPVDGLNYLVDYAAAIAEDKRLCSCYAYRGEAGFQAADPRVGIDGIRLWVFGTGIVFLDVLTSYGDMSLEEITHFAYLFKRINKKNVLAEGTLLQALARIVPAGVETFFTLGKQAGDFRKTCICMHMLYTRQQMDRLEAEQYIYALKRSYDTRFAYDPEDEAGIYDETYRPHSYMKWGLSPEGIVCLCTETDDPNTNAFLNGLMYSSHLRQEYYFMYLLLLNTRFSALSAVSEAAGAGDDLSLVEDLERRTIELKTRYWFRIVSDDMLYQNVYAKLYRILEIDRLLRDVEDNSAHLNVLEQLNEKKRGKRIQGLLGVLSVLTIFSALIDLASYLELFSSGAAAFALQSLLLILIIVCVCLCFLFYRDRKK